MFLSQNTCYNASKSVPKINGTYFYIKPLQLKFALGNVFNLYEALQENVEGDAWSKTGGYQKSNQGHKTTGNVIRHQLIVLFTSVIISHV